MVSAIHSTLLPPSVIFLSPDQLIYYILYVEYNIFLYKYT